MKVNFVDVQYKFYELIKKFDLCVIEYGGLGTQTKSELNSLPQS